MSGLPDWALWNGGEPATSYTLGAEEEIMLLNPHDWSLAQQIGRVLRALPEDLADHVTAETHQAALELRTGVHHTASGIAEELLDLRVGLDMELGPLGLRAGSAGTHPSTVWHETVVSSGGRYDVVYGSMRELARREPTFGLHAHVGVDDPEAAIRLCTLMRCHLPVLLALSVNSPFWQGRDTGLSSARTPLFQAFPRVGIPRAFGSYEEWVEAVDLLIRCDAFPEANFLWWDVRPQPRFGTVEIRIPDAQSTVAETAAIVALVQCLARLEIEEGYASELLAARPEALEENRFIAARDGMDAQLIDPEVESRVPVREQVLALLEACAPHAEILDCEVELAGVGALAERTGADHQLELARGGNRLPGLVAHLAEIFTTKGPRERPPPVDAPRWQTTET